MTIRATHPALAERAALFDLLAQWTERGWLREIDRAFAAFLAGLAPQAAPPALLAAALASHQLGHGHVCLDLAATLAAPDLALSLPPEGDTDPGAETPLPSRVLAGLAANDWLAACRACALVGPDGDGATPLVLAGAALYLRRYRDAEHRVARQITARLADAPEVPAGLPARLAALFTDSPVAGGARRTDWQKLACALALAGRFTVVTGGPGTGKTTTVVRLLALLQAAAIEHGAPLRLALAAPTGKAAARLTESIAAQVAALPVPDDVRRHIPTEVTTLHRLLGSRPGSRRFRHDAAHPLALDALVIDEASMIDLEMMDALLAALPPHARLVLLGDKDQLASVEAGAVLGSLCRDAELGGYSAATRAWLEQQAGERLADPALVPGDTPLAQHVVMLRHSRRFGSTSGIGRLAHAVNAGDAAAARAILSAGGDDLRTVALRGAADPALERFAIGEAPTAGPIAPAPHPGPAASQGARSQLPLWHDDAPAAPAGQPPGSTPPAAPLPGYAAYLDVLHRGRPAPAADAAAWNTWAGRVLAAFDRFRLLAAVRKGPWGVEALNARIGRALAERGLVAQDRGWYEGRPVLVTRNDYGLGLMNGDIGIALALPDADATPGSTLRPVLRVAFPRNDGSGALRLVLPSRLADVETVFAMTVHKSQGSEFDHCALVLPDAIGPVLTRELLYTAITRARHRFTLIEPRRGVFEQAVQRRTERRGGLRELLLGD